MGSHYYANFEKQTYYVQHCLLFCRGYLTVVLTQNNWFFLFCKIKKWSVFLGITLSTSPTDLPFTFTHTHTNSSYSNLHSHSHPTRDNIRFPNATRARFTDDYDECGTRICEPWSTWLTLAWSWWYPTPKWGHDNYISYILTLAWKLLTHDELSFVKAANCSLAIK